MSNIFPYILLILVILVCTGILIYQNRKVNHTFYAIDAMLESAMNGTFTERSFNETKLSALETKFHQYLYQDYTSSLQVAEERNKIKTLISDISHQTKTPIANLLLYSSLLEEQVTSTDQKSITKQLVQQSEKLNFLISALIKASRLETGIISLVPKHQSIAPLLEELYGAFQRRAKDLGILLKLNNQPLPAVYDNKWTSEALHNIMDNALKYTNPGGEIIISTSSYEIFQRIDITDTGMGMSESDINKIFWRFYRSPRVNDIQGVGIGLYLTREIIQSQGGYIKVRSLINEGSTFSVFLPRDD